MQRGPAQSWGGTQPRAGLQRGWSQHGVCGERVTKSTNYFRHSGLIHKRFNYLRAASTPRVVPRALPDPRKHFPPSFENREIGKTPHVCCVAGQCPCSLCSRSKTAPWAPGLGRPRPPTSPPLPRGRGQERMAECAEDGQATPGLQGLGGVVLKVTGGRTEPWGQSGCGQLGPHWGHTVQWPSIAFCSQGAPMAGDLRITGSGKTGVGATQPRSHPRIAALGGSLRSLHVCLTPSPQPTLSPQDSVDGGTASSARPLPGPLRKGSVAVAKLRVPQAPKSRGLPGFPPPPGGPSTWRPAPPQLRAQVGSADLFSLTEAGKVNEVTRF